MNIILLISADDHPDIPKLREILETGGVQWTETDNRPVGNISQIPCIAALDDSGVARMSGGTDLTAGEVQNYAAADSAPLPKPTIYSGLNKSQFEALYAANGSNLTATLAAWPTT